jgi:hypothetical protein
MAVVIVYARHSKKCHKSTVKGSGQYRRCKCPLWLRWGDSKRSAKTRSWEIANKKARRLEEELNQKALGVDVPKAPEPISIEAAAELYLADMVQRGKGTGKSRRMSRIRRSSTRPVVRQNSTGSASAVSVAGAIELVGTPFLGNDSKVRVTVCYGPGPRPQISTLKVADYGAWYFSWTGTELKLIKHVKKSGHA